MTWNTAENHAKTAKAEAEKLQANRQNQAIFIASNTTACQPQNFQGKTILQACAGRTEARRNPYFKAGRNAG
jgi:hypothetical protein